MVVAVLKVKKAVKEIPLQSLPEESGCIYCVVRDVAFGAAREPIAQMGK